ARGSGFDPCLAVRDCAQPGSRVSMYLDRGIRARVAELFPGAGGVQLAGESRLHALVDLDLPSGPSPWRDRPAISRGDGVLPAGTLERVTAAAGADSGDGRDRRRRPDATRDPVCAD